jgi:hypothetical protein
MAIKSFTSGEILTAADTNAYLTNAGLVYVNSVTPTAATTVGLNSCFTSTYANYRVIVTPVSAAGSTDIDIRLRVGGVAAVGANYYMTNIFSGAGLITSSSENTRTSFRGAFLGAAGNATFNSIAFDIYGPQLAIATRYQLQSSGWDGTNIANRSATGYHSLATAYDGIEFLGSSAITATITVFGYRQA